MSCQHSPKIITNGLILYLDSNNTKSYTGTGTTWYDLSGMNNHHTILNSPTLNTNPKRFTLDGLTQGFTKVGSLNGQTTSMTVCIWYKTSEAAELWVRGNSDNNYFLAASNNNNYYHRY